MLTPDTNPLEMNTETQAQLLQLFQQNFANTHSFCDAFYQHMALPDSAFLGTRLTKKMLMDSATHNELSLSAQDKQLITDVIQSVEWRYALKPETVNIAPFVNEQLEYSEIALVHVVFKAQEEANDKAQQKALTSSFNKLAKLLHKLIPYPLLIVAEHQDSFAISLAEKRINQADKSKLVVEHHYNSKWFTFKQYLASDAKNCSLSSNEQAFLLDFSLKNTATINYYALYQDLIAMLIALETSYITGHYQAKSQVLVDLLEAGLSPQSESPQSNEQKTALLKQLEALQSELNALRNSLKKETQMNNKMRINVEAKKLKTAIADIQAQL